MGIGMHMTIQDYFNQGGLPRRQPVAVKGVISRPTNAATPFLRALSAAQSSTGTGAKGWTIRDYMDRPVHLRRPLAASLVERKPRPSQPSEPIGYEHSIAPEGAPKHDTPLDADMVGKNGRIQASIMNASVRYDLPPSLIEAVIKAESDYNVQAVSSAGAQGLMQLMPATARELGVDNPFDIDQNIQGGARYLRLMLDRFKGDIKLALSAYNAGPGTVAKFRGHVPYPETQNYIRRVMEYSSQLSSAEKSVS